MTRLSDIEKRWAKATPGPWEAVCDGSQTPLRFRRWTVEREGTMERCGRVCAIHHWNAQTDEADALAIASAPSDIAWLIGRVRELEDAIRLEIANNHVYRSFGRDSDAVATENEIIARRGENWRGTSLSGILPEAEEE